MCRKFVVLNALESKHFKKWSVAKWIGSRLLMAPGHANAKDRVWITRTVSTTNKQTNKQTTKKEKIRGRKKYIYTVELHFTRMLHCKFVNVLLYFIILLFITLLFIILLLCLCWYSEQPLAQEFPLGLIKFCLISCSRYYVSRRVQSCGRKTTEDLYGNFPSFIQCWERANTHTYAHTHTHISIEYLVNHKWCSPSHSWCRSNLELARPATLVSSPDTKPRPLNATLSHVQTLSINFIHRQDMGRLWSIYLYCICRYIYIYIFYLIY